MSSVFSIEDAKLLKNIVTDYVKIPSFESRNLQLIEYCRDNFNKLLISTGTSNWNEVKKTANTLHFIQANFTLLHCVSSYPCTFDIVNLPRIGHLNRIHSSVGFSDHSQGIESSVLSLKYGVDYIEKHFTIDNDLPGRDNKFAILPNEMKRLSEYIKISDKVMVDKGSDFQECELDSRNNYTGRFDG
jgi:sialic acid synthase SpsE